MNRFTFTDSFGTCKPNKSGYNFFHESVLTDTETGQTWTGRMVYGNRTWEPHKFYSSRRCAVESARQSFEDQAVQKAQDERRRYGLAPVGRVTKKFRERAVAFYGDGIALAALAGVKC